MASSDTLVFTPSGIMPSDGKSRQQRRALAFGGYCWDMALESRLDVALLK